MVSYSLILWNKWPERILILYCYLFGLVLDLDSYIF